MDCHAWVPLTLYQPFPVAPGQPPPSLLSRGLFSASFTAQLSCNPVDGVRDVCNPLSAQPTPARTHPLSFILVPSPITNFYLPIAPGATPAPTPYTSLQDHLQTQTGDNPS